MKTLLIELEHDPDNQLTAAISEKQVIISVSQEKAVDSYNTVFECSIDLDVYNAIKLRDWLIENITKL